MEKEQNQPDEKKRKKKEENNLALTEWGMDVSNFVLSEFLLG